MAAPLLAEDLGGGAGSTGGALFLALIAAVAFATILAVVAGLTLSASPAVAHDICGDRRRGKDSEKRGGRGRPIAAVRSASIAIASADPRREGLNVAFLVGLAFAVAASANLPAILLRHWRRFNTARRVCWSIYGGLISVRSAW